MVCPTLICSIQESYQMSLRVKIIRLVLLLIKSIRKTVMLRSSLVTQAYLSLNNLNSNLISTTALGRSSPQWYTSQRNSKTAQSVLRIKNLAKPKYNTIVTHITQIPWKYWRSLNQTGVITRSKLPPNIYVVGQT